MKTTKTYRYFDCTKGEWIYFEGESKTDALERNFGHEQGYMINKNYTIERVYSGIPKQ